MTVAIVFASGCGDGEDDTATTGANSSTGSSAPGGSSGSVGSSGSDSTGGSLSFSLSNLPPGEIVQGTQFSYTPTVINPDGVSLSFSAENLPGWASINASTGQITGTPGPDDIGAYPGIRISVAGGGAEVTSPSYSIDVVGTGLGSALLSWQAPAQREDGSVLGSALAGYRVYWGLSPSDLSNSVDLGVGVMSYVIDELTPATWYFAATAYDTEGNESGLSNILSKQIL